MESKTKTIAELTGIADKLRKDGCKIVLCHGVFDLLHPGHIRHFQAAKKKGDILIVTITRDEFVNKGPGRPVFNQQLRAESVAALGCVDFVGINEWPTAVETIKALRPHYYMKGSDYAKKEEDLTGKIIEEEEAVKEAGGELLFTDEMAFSSSSIINTHLSSLPDAAQSFVSDFRRRYTSADILGFLASMKNLKVLVIGDIIIDEYHYCVGMGKSQKDNIIAARFLNEETFAGGALAAANHVAGFCQEVTLLSWVGTANSYDGFIERHLKPNISRKLYYRRDVPTVVKRRFIDPSFLTKLFEICYLDNENCISADIELEIGAYLQSDLKRFDAVIVTDFGHGLITERIMDILCRHARFLAVNVQANSANFGFNVITKFKRADYICIDEPEIRLACHDRTSELETLISAVGTQLSCGKIIITRGHRGSLAYAGSEGFTEIPVLSTRIVDRIGAGDAFFSVTAPLVLKGAPMEVVGFIGNAVGAMKVLIVGNRASVEPAPLSKYVTTMLK